MIRLDPPLVEDFQGGPGQVDASLFLDIVYGIHGRVCWFELAGM